MKNTFNDEHNSLSMSLLFCDWVLDLLRFRLHFYEIIFR